MEKREIQLLVIVAGALRVGLPIEHVRETMRPLKIEVLREALPFVLGVSVIRGEAVPVVDLGALLTGRRNQSSFRRFVTLRVSDRIVALAVDEVEFVLSVSDAAFSALPPLLSEAGGESVERLSLADAQLLFTLKTTRLISAAHVSGEATAS